MKKEKRESHDPHLFLFPTCLTQSAWASASSVQLSGGSGTTWPEADSRHRKWRRSSKTKARGAVKTTLVSSFSSSRFFPEEWLPRDEATGLLYAWSPRGRGRKTEKHQTCASPKKKTCAKFAEAYALETWKTCHSFGQFMLLARHRAVLWNVLTISPTSWVALQGAWKLILAILCPCMHIFPSSLTVFCPYSVRQPARYTRCQHFGNPSQWNIILGERRSILSHPVQDAQWEEQSAVLRSDPRQNMTLIWLLLPLFSYHAIYLDTVYITTSSVTSAESQLYFSSDSQTPLKGHSNG